MRIRDFIRDQFKKRLAAAGCLVVYDGEGRYRDCVLALASETCPVVHAGKSIILVDALRCHDGFQNRVACRAPISDTLSMTLKMKQLLGVDSGCAVSSVVEHFLDTEGVRGSNPLSRTISLRHR